MTPCWRASLVTQIAADRAPGAELVRAGGAVVWIADAREESLWRDNPMVAGPPYLRFFAGAPIALASGARIGSLQAYGPEPQPYDERAARALADLAALVADECARILLQRDLARAEGEARSARETMAAFVEASPASIVMTDSAFRVIRSSPSWRADMRLEGVDVVGQSLQELFPGAMGGGGERPARRRSPARSGAPTAPKSASPTALSFGCRSRSHRGATATGKSRAC